MGLAGQPALGPWKCLIKESNGSAREREGGGQDLPVPCLPVKPFNNSVICEQTPLSSTLKRPWTIFAEDQKFALVPMTWGCRLIVSSLYCTETLFFLFPSCYLLQTLLDVVKKAFSAFIDTITRLLPLSQFMWWIIFTDFLMLRQPYTSGMEPTWS